MKKCEKCKSNVKDDNIKKLKSTVLCDDCYIDEVMPKMPKSHYNNDAEFLNRLKNSYPVCQQQYH